MTSAILTIISGLFTLAGKIFDWLYARDLVNAGKVQAELEALRKQVRSAQIAVAAREAQRALDAANADRAGGVSIDESDPNLRD